MGRMRTKSGSLALRRSCFVSGNGRIGRDEGVAGRSLDVAERLGVVKVCWRDDVEIVGRMRWK